MSRQSADLPALLAEIESHVHAEGWDQQPRLFALVDTADLLEREPALAGELTASGAADELTAVEQDDLPGGDLAEVLGAIGWPETVLGVAILHEVLVLPPSAEADLPQIDPLPVARDHAARRDVRMGAAVLRDGSRACALRLRGEGEEHLISGPDLAPALCDALLATLED